jgi:CRISPR/Cas system-associated exonuclease Cas4 (RecB family)
VARRIRYHSISGIGTYWECPQRFKFDYVDKRRGRDEVPAEHFGVGRAGHAGLEAALKGEDPMEAARAKWLEDGLSEHGGGLERCLEYVADVAPALREEALSYDEVLGVEHKFLLDTPEGTGFIGYADAVFRLGNAALVRDYKFRSHKAEAADLAEDIQGGMYCWAAKTTWPWVRDMYFEHYYPPLRESVRVKVTDENLEAALDRFEATVELIEADAEWRPSPGEHCGYCKHQEVCPAFQRTSVMEDALKF